MDYSKINVMAMMKTRMAYLAERQDVLSQNVANANTPGYMPKDLKKLDFSKLAMMESSRLSMRATQPNHFPTGKTNDVGAFKAGKMRGTYETTPVKNGVSLEEQMMMVSQTQMDYQTTTDLYKKTADMFKIAIGKN